MGQYLKVAVIDNEIEAQIIKDILLKQDIPHEVKSYHSTAFDGLFQLQNGWGAVMAPEEYHQEIREILSELRKS
ncbi:MAG: hypothetical protein FH758_02070 [Firmicutes bacterium]|nr:hypothetical protein [Bacillota bacterium]